MNSPSVLVEGKIPFVVILLAVTTFAFSPTVCSVGVSNRVLVRTGDMIEAGSAWVQELLLLYVTAAGVFAIISAEIDASLLLKRPVDAVTLVIVGSVVEAGSCC